MSAKSGNFAVSKLPQKLWPYKIKTQKKGKYTFLVSPAELSNRLFPCAGFSVSKNSSQIRLLSGKQVIGETLARKNIFFLIEEKRNT